MEELTSARARAIAAELDNLRKRLDVGDPDMRVVVARKLMARVAVLRDTRHRHKIRRAAYDLEDGVDVQTVQRDLEMAKADLEKEADELEAQHRSDVQQGRIAEQGQAAELNQRQNSQRQKWRILRRWRKG